MAKLKIANQTSVTNVKYPQPEGDRFVSPILINGYHFGGVGGLSSDGGLQITSQVNLPGGSSTVGSIVAQKGAHKFRVTDGTRTGVCTLVNSPNPTTGQMNILVTLNSASASIAAANVAGGATSTTLTLSGVTGVVTLPRVGDWLSWTAPSANIGSFVQVTGVNGSTITIGTVGNVAAVSGVSVTTNTYASKINNKYVWDWTSDGVKDSTSGTVTFMTSGYNPNRYRYVLSGSAGPNATFVKVQSA